MARGYKTHYVRKFAKVKLSLIHLGAVKKYYAMEEEE